MSEQNRSPIITDPTIILDALTDAAVIVDEHGTVLVGNHAWWTMLDLPTPPTQPRSYADYMTSWWETLPNGTPSGDPNQSIARALAGEQIVGATVRLHHPRTGQICVLVQSATPLRDPQGNMQGVLVVSRDVTAHAELEQAKDAFLLFAGHELRTPLTALRGFMDLAADRLRVLEHDLAAGKPLDMHALGRLRHMLERSDVSSVRLDRLIEQLLDISRMQAGRLIIRPLPLDLGDLVSAAVTRFIPTVPRHTVTIHIDDTTAIVLSSEDHSPNGRAVSAALMVSVDQSRMEQVLFNVLSNAARFSPPETAIDVRVHRDKDEVIVSVRDRGPGVPHEDRQRIFGLFLRSGTTPQALSGIAGGLGVGLYISREVVMMHGGRIWVDDDPHGEAGSVFHIAVPAFIGMEPPASAL